MQITAALAHYTYITLVVEDVVLRCVPSNRPVLMPSAKRQAFVSISFQTSINSLYPYPYGVCHPIQQRKDFMHAPAANFIGISNRRWRPGVNLTREKPSRRTYIILHLSNDSTLVVGIILYRVTNNINCKMFLTFWILFNNWITSSLYLNSPNVIYLKKYDVASTWFIQNYLFYDNDEFLNFGVIKKCQKEL